MQQYKRVQLPQITIASRMPHEIALHQSKSPLLSGLWVESTGYFPNALGHVTERAPENVTFYLVIYCLSGTGWFQSKEKRWTIKSGDVAIALPGLAHGYGANDDDPWTIQWAHFNGHEVAALLRLASVIDNGTVIALDQPLSLFSLFNE